MKPQAVVIIEDEEAHFSLMHRVISKELPHVALHHFSTPITFLETLGDIAPAVIVTDYLMPGMTGLEFLEILNEKNMDIPVIIITGQGDENIAVRAMKLGAKDYLVKSGNFFALLPSVIEQAIREKELKQSLQESEKRFHDLAESTSDWIWEMDEAGRFLYSNPAVETILGWPRDLVVGKCFFDFFAEPQKALLKEKIFKTLSTGRPIKAFDSVLVRKDGIEIITETNGVPFFDKSGRLSGYRGVSRDISLRKRSEAQIHKLSQQLIKAQEDERKMISCELHDRVAQDLSVSRIECDMLLKDQGLNPGVKDKLRGISNILKNAIDSVRDLSYDLRPPSLDQMDFVQAIFQYCEDFSEKTGIKVDFTAAGLGDLHFDYNTKINLYRLVQEGLNNIWKHAEASVATVKLAALYPKIILRISDNGKGFDVKSRLSSMNYEKRLGLRSMNERVNLLQGELEIQSKIKQGTKISIKIPYAVQKRHERAVPADR